MSEKIQRTAATMRKAMHHRYDDGLHHKHNKCRLPYRQHWRSHSDNAVPLINGFDHAGETDELLSSTQEKNIKKTRLRIVKLSIH